MEWIIKWSEETDTQHKGKHNILMNLFMENINMRVCTMEIFIQWTIYIYYLMINIIYQVEPSSILAYANILSV